MDITLPKSKAVSPSVKHQDVYYEIKLEGGTRKKTLLEKIIADYNEKGTLNRQKLSQPKKVRSAESEEEDLNESLKVQLPSEASVNKQFGTRRTNRILQTMIT